MKNIVVALVVLVVIAVAGVALAQSTVNYSTPSKSANVLRIDRISLVPYLKTAEVCGSMMNAKQEAVESRCVPLDFKSVPGLYNIVKYAMAILGSAFGAVPSVPMDPTK